LLDHVLLDIQFSISLDEIISIRGTTSEKTGINPAAKTGSDLITPDPKGKNSFFGHLQNITLNKNPSGLLDIIKPN